MRLRDRLDRAEQTVDCRRFCGCSERPTVIHVYGGIAGAEPSHATIGQITIERGQDETLEEFQERAIDFGGERCERFAVIGGLPASDSGAFRR
jgi:hypothetical protein